MLLKKKPCVIAGLVTAMGVSLALSGPVCANAAESTSVDVCDVPVSEAAQELQHELGRVSSDVAAAENGKQVTVVDAAASGSDAEKSASSNVAHGSENPDGSDSNNPDAGAGVPAGKVDNSLEGSSSGDAESSEAKDPADTIEPSGNEGVDAKGEDLVAPPEKTYTKGWNYDDAADEWHFSDNGGDCVKDAWRYINGNWYWFDENGLMSTGVKQVGDQGYHFRESGGFVGAMYIGWSQDASDSSWYLSSASGFLQKGWVYDGSWYYMNPETYKMRTGWLEQGPSESPARYYLTGSGAMVSDNWVLDGSDWYYADASGAMAKGWRYVGGSWYYMDPSTGKMAKGLQQVGGSKYFLDNASGAMAVGWGLDSDGSWYWGGPSGALATGWVKAGSSWYYMDLATNKMRTGWLELGPSESPARYYLAGSGAMVSDNWVLDGSDWYYADASGAMAKGWRYVGGSWYYMDPSTGKMAKGLQQVGGSKYFLDNASGAMAVGWGLDSDGSWYWGGPSGALATGWVKAGSSWYYMDPATYKMLIGFRVINNSEYFFNKDTGAMIVGWGYDSYTSKWYLGSSSGALLQGWQLVNGSWYWMDPTTKVMAQNEWLKYKGDAYYLLDSGAMATSRIVRDGGIFYVDQAGISRAGWHNNYYFDSTADTMGRFAALLGLQKIDGAEYYFDAAKGMMTKQWVDYNGTDKAYACTDGKISSDIVMRGGVFYQKNSYGSYTKISNREFDLDGATFRADGDGHLVLGWVTVGGGEKYYSVSGLRKAEFFTLDGTTDGAKYYSDASGFKKVGKLLLDTVTYYLGDNGVLRTGWLDMQSITGFKDGRHHFGDSDGAMAVDWLLLSNNWYLFDGDGVMLTKWQDKRGQRYYLDPTTGIMKTGWFEDKSDGEDNWYFFQGSGAMATGWAYASNSWYYFTTKDNFTSYDKVLYKKKGQMLTGWLSAGGNWFFLSRSQGWDGYAKGAMVVGLHNIDGKKYAFDQSGAQDTRLEWVMSRIMGLSSGTQYLIAVDSASYHTYVFQGSAGNWTPIYNWLCGVWMNGYSKVGDYYVGGDGACYNYTRWADGRNNFKGGYRTTYYPEDDIRYFTGICLDLGFHSCIGWEGGYSDWGQLGKNISHGCIRLLESCAKWVYDNALPGTRVLLY